MKYFSIVMLMMFAVLANAQPVKKYGALKVDGTQLVDKNSEPAVLRGVSLGWHNFWPRFYNAETVNWLIDDWHINVIRAAMGIELENAYLSNPEFAKKVVKAVVDAAIKRDIYVIIDWHSHNLNQKEALEFFTEMAQQYGEYPHVIYEIFNEPDYESWKDVKSYSVALINSIRKYDSDNIILVGSPHWDQDLDIVADDPLEGQENIMYTLHYYAATHSDSLRMKGDYAIEKGIPLFISECAGMQANGDGALDYNEWQKWINWAEEKKISWIVWSIADKNETCSMLTPIAGSYGNWNNTQLKESGTKTKELLIRYNTDHY